MNVISTRINANAHQAKLHGNEPSKGAKIDQELKEEEDAILAKKGAKK
jgi:hypothetical protein